MMTIQNSSDYLQNKLFTKDTNDKKLFKNFSSCSAF